MTITHLGIKGTRFIINGAPIYADIPGSKESAHGLLMNARFIQGIFDDIAAPDRFARFGCSSWDPERNTDELIAALPQWYRYGLRAITVGFQGGGPCFTTDNMTISNNPFGETGTSLSDAYANRMDRLIREADRVGMVVIVSYLYGAQTRFLHDGTAVKNAVVTASRFLRENAYTNVIIEIANEHDVHPFKVHHPLVAEPEGMAALLELARKESGGLPVGCSGVGGSVSREICEASDVLLIHGNGCTRQQFSNLIDKTRSFAPDKPVVCNEDSPAIGQLLVAFEQQVSWGYYNNATKQEPPAMWGVLPGEDLFFAKRMAMGIGIEIPETSSDDRYYLQGLEPGMHHDGKRWIRLASLFPESINYVDFFKNGSKIYTCYDEPFSVHYETNWKHEGAKTVAGDRWTAAIALRDGSTLEKSAVTPD